MAVYDMTGEPRDSRIVGDVGAFPIRADSALGRAVLETPDGLADHLADLLGIYNDPRCEYRDEDWHHVERCQCRVWWAPAMADRIRNAVKTELSPPGDGRILDAVLRLLDEDAHTWSKRPCPTCDTVSRLAGFAFGCTRKRREA